MRPLTAALIGLTAALPAQAQTPTQTPSSPADAVTRLFSGPVQPAWLAPSFLAALPAAVTSVQVAPVSGLPANTYEITIRWAQPGDAEPAACILRVQA